MKETLVMTLIGPDRPGLVESVAAVVARHGGNWLESRMSRLGGQFAGILRVEMPSAEREPLIKALNSLNSARLSIVAHADAPVAVAAPRSLYRLEITGQDRPGIVKEITGALAAEQVNVEEFESELRSAAMSGETLFTARATLSLPATGQTDRIRQRLEKIAADLIVELTLAPLQDPG